MRILVIGFGSIGRRHVGNLIRLEAGRISVHDPALRAGRRLERDPALQDVRLADTPEKGLAAGVDLVVVASPTPLHVEHALAAARAGAHVLIEKPLGHALDGVDALVEELKRHGRVGMVACNMRFHPGPAAVKRWVAAGDVGVPLAGRWHSGSHLPGWRPAQDYRGSYSADVHSGGAVLDCIHEIDLALWTLGPAQLVAAAARPARSLGLETDGLAELILRHESGALGSVHLNFVQRNTQRCCQVIGSEGTAAWDWESGRAVLYGADGSVRQESAQPAGWDPNRMYLDELAHFLRAARSGAPPMNAIREAAATLRIALDARRCR